ncbi:MAG: tetratricopeptide repeat protein [bacterium]|nr:tetratricopeptide repeat protein [bacterium]
MPEKNRAELLLDEARSLARDGQHAEALPIYQRLTAAVGQQLGEDSTALIYLLREQAYQHHALGQPEEAEPLYRRALTIGEKRLPAASPDNLPTLRALAALTLGRGKHAEARSLFERALAIQEADGVAPTQDLARTYGDLALLSQLEGRVGESEKQYRRAVEVGESTGLDQVSLATLVNNLGAVCAAQDRLDEAEPLYRRALSMREAALGPEHQDVAFVLKELASVYHRQGHLDRAAPLYERSLEIQERAGQGNQAISELVDQLAIVHRLLKQPAEAEKYFERSVKIAAQALGPDHPNVAVRNNNLAVFYVDQGRFGEAENLYRRTLAVQESAFGDRHVSVAVTLVNLASLHQKQGRLNQARDEASRAKSILDDECGPGNQRGGFCASALEVHRELMDRLEGSADSASPPPVAPEGAPVAAESPGKAPEKRQTVTVVAPFPAADPVRAAGAMVYRAQVASRQDRGGAERELAKLRAAHADLLGTLPGQVAHADLGDRGVWYRIQFGAYAGKSQAQALCDGLSARGLDGCWVIETER